MPRSTASLTLAPTPKKQSAKRATKATTPRKPWKPVVGPDIQRQVYSPAELAHVLGLKNVMTVYRHIKAGDIPAQRVGNRYLISRAWAHTHLVQPSADYEYSA